MGTSRASKDLLMKVAINDLSGAVKPLKQKKAPSNIILIKSNATSTPSLSNSKAMRTNEYKKNKSSPYNGPYYTP